MDISSIAGVITAGKELVALLREFKALLPDSEKAAELVKRLEDAERKLQEQQALTAKDLGYQLCQCTYPPQIMLFKRKTRSYECPLCGDNRDNMPIAFHKPNRPF